jgi:hypothetical protein
MEEMAPVHSVGDVTVVASWSPIPSPSVASSRPDRRAKAPGPQVSSKSPCPLSECFYCTGLKSFICIFLPVPRGDLCSWPPYSCELRPRDGPATSSFSSVPGHVSSPGISHCADCASPLHRRLDGYPPHLINDGVSPLGFDSSFSVLLGKLGNAFSFS